MKTLLTFSAFLICCIFWGCKKEKQFTYIEGIVINTGSKQPIDSVLVSLHDGLGSSVLLGGGQTVGSENTVTTYTDKNGHFKISILADAPFLWLSKNGYRFVQVAPSGTLSTDPKSYLSGSNNSNQVLTLWANAYFQGIFKGRSSLPTDSIYFDEASQKVSLDWLRSRNHWNFGNGPFGPPYPFLEIGDKYFSYWIEYQIHGVWHQKIDSVYIKSFTTYRDTIYF